MEYAGAQQRLRTALHIQFTKNMVDVPFYRTHADKQGVGNLLIRLTLRNQTQNLQFAFSQGIEQKRGGGGIRGGG